MFELKTGVIWKFCEILRYSGDIEVYGFCLQNNGYFDKQF